MVVNTHDSTGQDGPGIHLHRARRHPTDACTGTARFADPEALRLEPVRSGSGSRRSRTHGRRGGMKYAVNTFAGASMPCVQATDGTFPADAPDTLQGTATQDGCATGLYARKDLPAVDAAVVGTPAETGRFSANAELTAHFGNTATAGVAGECTGHFTDGHVTGAPGAANS